MKPRTIPALWTLARAMFSNVPQSHCPELLRERRVFSRRQKNEIVSWLEPVEKLVRTLLVCGALLHLIMTPEGRAMLHRGPTRGFPNRPPPPGQLKHPNRIPHPGWHTIAQPYRPEPPAPEPEPARDPQQKAPACSFRVFSWSFDDPFADDPPAKPLAARKGPMIIRLDEPRRLHRLFDKPPGQKPASPPPTIDEPAPMAVRLANRMEALRRVLANPEPAILRLACWIASFPGNAADWMAFPRDKTKHWQHGAWDYQDACRTMFAILVVYGRLEPG